MAWGTGWKEVLPQNLVLLWAGPKISVFSCLGYLLSHRWIQVQGRLPPEGGEGP